MFFDISKQPGCFNGLLMITALRPTHLLDPLNKSLWRKNPVRFGRSGKTSIGKRWHNITRSIPEMLGIVGTSMDHSGLLGDSVPCMLFRHCIFREKIAQMRSVGRILQVYNILSC
jgi:hypothetical protein